MTEAKKKVFRNENGLVQCEIASNKQHVYGFIFFFNFFLLFKKARFISSRVDFTELFSPIEKSLAHKKFTVQFH